MMGDGIMVQFHVSWCWERDEVDEFPDCLRGVDGMEGFFTVCLLHVRAQGSIVCEIVNIPQ